MGICCNHQDNKLLYWYKRPYGNKEVIEAVHKCNSCGREFILRIEMNLLSECFIKAHQHKYKQIL